MKLIISKNVSNVFKTIRYMKMVFAEFVLMDNVVPINITLIFIAMSVLLITVKYVNINTDQTLS